MRDVRLTGASLPAAWLACLRGVRDPRGITFLTNQYSAGGRVICQIQADGGEWRFAYTSGPPPSLQAPRWSRVVGHPPLG